MNNYKALGMTFRVIYKTLEHNKNKILESLELTSSQAGVLIYLLQNQNNEINQKDIESYLNLKNPTVTGILNRLEIKGFITRVASDKDARYKKIVLTNKSKDKSKEIFDEIEIAEKHIIRGMSQKEVDLLSELLAKVLNNLNT
jgi:DNA-binding MarR family transcriptional regulator